MADLRSRFGGRPFVAQPLRQCGGELDRIALLPVIAGMLLGSPNSRLSRDGELRFGSKGSLSVDTKNGRWFDHEAGEGGGVLELIARKRGGTLADAILWMEHQGLSSGSGGNIVPIRTDSSTASVFFDYVAADGEVRFRVERTFDKRFRQHGPDGNGGFFAAPGCMERVERIPYRLPELIAASPATTIYVVEGEKHCDALARLGIVATTNPAGAGKWIEGWGRRYFAGRTVVILPDNDEPGHRHGAKVAADLDGHASGVVVLNLPSVGEKGDVLDWLAQGGTASELERLVGAAFQSGSASDFDLIDPASWANIHPPEREWLWQEWLPRGQVSLLTGAGSAGKSLLGQQLATSVALGRPCLGIPTVQGRAIYITCEDDAQELHRRQDAICNMLGIRMSDLSGKLWLSSWHGLLENELATFTRDGKMCEARRYHALVAECRRVGAKFVVLDNTAHLFAGNENDRHQVAAFLNLLNRLADEIEGAVLLVGHPNKIGDDYSGSTAWQNQVRSRVFMEIPSDKDGEPINPNARTIARRKVNYSMRGEAVCFHWHDWAFVREEDLEPEAGAELAARILADEEDHRFLACLDKATGERRATSHAKAASNYAPRVFVVMPTSKGMKGRAFERAMHRLLHLGVIAGDQPLWQRSNRNWVRGLGRAPDPAPTAHEPLHESARTEETT